MICHNRLITGIECVNGSGTPYTQTGDVAFCNVTEGFRCLNSENWFLEDEQCDDYKVRFYCSCREDETTVRPPTTSEAVATTTPSGICIDHWTQFFNENTPTHGENGFEIESLHDLKEKYMICYEMLITDIECVNATGTPYYETGDVAFCDVTQGFRCLNSENWFLEDEQCDDYKVRFFCSCPETTTPETTTPEQCDPYWTEFFDESTPTIGLNGQETETLEDLRTKYMICHGQPITDVECVDENGISYRDTGDVASCTTEGGLVCNNHDNWFTEDKQCSNYKVRFQCGCQTTTETPTTTETTTTETPTTTPLCTPYWTDYFDESTPTIGLNGQETETLEDLRTMYMICHGLPITDVECVDENGVSYLDTGDVASCTTEEGLLCSNHDNWFTEDKQCSNYKVRFYCGCPEPICNPYWTDYFDESTPTIGLNGQETETLEDLRTKYMICHGLPITDVQCVDDDDVSYLDTGDVASCTTSEGLTCSNHDNWFTHDQQCSNYRVRFQCGCPTTPEPPCAPQWTDYFDESSPTIGLNGQETETLEDLRTKYMICHNQPITNVECVDENGISYLDTGDVASCTTSEGLTCLNSENWFTDDQQCSNYRVRFQCGCSTPEPPCAPQWTDYFDESSPTTGRNGQETETLEDLRTKYMICHNQPITDVECVDENGVSYLDTGDVASCTTEAGLTCLNSENWFTADKQCSNYRVRFLCGCQETTTSQPVTTHPPFSGNVSEVFIHTIMEGFDYTLNMSIKGTEDYMMLEEGVLQMIGMMFDDYLGTGINVSIVSVVNGSVDVTTKLDLYEELIPTAYSRILGNDWLKTVLVDELPPERYAYLLSIDEARRTLDEEHGHEHTLHYAMRNCGDFVPGCVPKELCLTWENETNCRCFTGYVDSHGHICTDGYCEPYWTPFFNTNTTTAGEFGGEMELLENVRQGNYSICDDDYIIDIMCRKVGTNLTADDLGQTVLCNNTMGLSGLRCFNSDNLDTDAGQCEDYEVSYKCGCEIEIVTSVLSSRMVGIEWSVRFTDKNSWEYKLVEEYYMKMTRTMLADIDGIFGMRFLGITPGSIIVSVEINSTRAAVHLLRYRSLELDDDWHFVPDDMTMGNMSIWELMGDQCTSSLHTTCTPVETCFLHHHGEYRCRCHSGFIEIENKTRCIDVDECEVAIDECAMYNKSCTNLPGSHACHCPDGLVWNVTSSSCGEPIVAKWVPIRLNVTDCSDLDCSPGTCEYDTAGTPFCRCPDGTKRNNCHEGLIGDAETGSLAALAALAAIIPCCCCLAILAARKQRKKRKLLLLHSTGVSSHRCSQNDR
ncbi:PREDICTED: mucin-5AC-like isoform X2 [Branchiostoma belcheri]|uniref:Mucin-5AC-like isoform X2 n=1 Tax=Branchiostoma belcheri TaxID=7741 RepID=A0A6P4XT43_BRABE|nr:PREDICTED: mucin-5AC-like isoform X2 [Branchiostoma belcheri]